MRINPWGNHQEIVNGHVVGADEQASIYWATNVSLDAYMRRFWLQGGGDLFPCGCSPTAGWDAPHHRIDLADFRHQSHYAFIPTAGVGGQAQNIANRALVDYNQPTTADSIFPGGQQLQGQLYEALNGYWLGEVP